MHNKHYDVIIVGAGAAGLMTAITAARGGLKVLLLEGQKKVGAKILMSGGTRCNVTNKKVSEKDYSSERLIDVRNILRSFDNQKTIHFFKELGVELILEPTGKYFPTTNSGKTVLDALLREVTQVGVELLTERKVLAVRKIDQGFVVQGEGFQLEASAVVLTTGGLSYPGTGSDGVGYRLAQTFGHGMIETIPALTPLTTKDADFKSLSGITLDVTLNLISDGKKIFSTRESFLFTHLGFSGPAALDISRHYLRAKEPREITINFMGDQNPEIFQQHLLALQQNNSRKALKNILLEHMPQRLVDALLKKSGIDALTLMNQLNRESRQRIIQNCFRCLLPISGVVGYTKAEVTAGGISFAEINSKTLESQLQPGLFFAGEILDVDDRIGGFNFQWAWASGYTVAQALINERK